ncbi:radical SAM protein [Saccharomonospora xinjiangensis]|uniref:radical SAM protein n=1 Tax=Saccharomonospora xinjiangensis TaxID=75294 RepID=UPI00350FF34D
MTVRMVNGKVFNPEGVEVNATLQCNMRCRSCAHLSPLFRRENADPDEVHEQLSLLAHSYHASYAKIMGGEPLLHPEILALIAAVRSSGVADTILVATNGTLLHRAPVEFWAAADAVELSLYPSRMPDDDTLQRFRELAVAHEVDLLINHYDHFRATYSEHADGSPSVVQDVYDTCKLAHYWHSHTVIDGWFYRCPQSVFMPRQGVAGGWDPRVDGIELAGDPGFADRLYAFLRRPEPLRACRNCLGSVGVRHPHEELDRANWRPAAGVVDLLDPEFLEVCRADITADDGCVRVSESYPARVSR